MSEIRLCDCKEKSWELVCVKCGGQVPTCLDCKELEAELAEARAGLENEQSLNRQHLATIDKQKATADELAEALRWYKLNVGALQGTPEIYAEAMQRIHNDIGATASEALARYDKEVV